MSTTSTTTTTDHPPMRLRAMLPYFGGKRGLAPLILDALAPEVSSVRRYFEPFHGSLAVLLELRDRGYTRPAVVNDLHRLAHNLATVVADRDGAIELAQDFGLALCHEAAMFDCAARIHTLLQYEDLAPHLRVDLARAYLAFSWLHRSGMAGTEIDWGDIAGGFSVRWTASGGDPAVRYQQIADSIPGWWSRLQKTTFTRRDGFGVIEKIPDEAGVVVYLDPPYLSRTRKKGDYAHDFTDAGGMLLATDDDHARLAGLCARFTRARVGVSYYDEPRVRELYPPGDGWRVVNLQRNKNLSNARAGSTGEAACEVLIVNDRRKTDEKPPENTDQHPRHGGPLRDRGGCSDRDSDGGIAEVPRLLADAPGAGGAP